MALLANSDHGDWADCVREGDEQESATTKVFAVVRERAEALEWNDVSPDAVIEDALQVLSAWERGDISELCESRLRAGFVLNIEKSVQELKQCARWGFIQDRTSDWNASEEESEILQALLLAQQGSGLDVRAIDLATIEVGFGVSTPLGTVEWPHTGMESTGSFFEGPQGMVQDWQSIEDSNQSVHFRFRVRIADGRIGHIRLNYLYDERTELWLPVAAASSMYEPGEHATWCFVN